MGNGPVAGSSEHDNEPAGFINGLGFLNDLKH